jgi:hypothetical protein
MTLVVATSISTVIPARTVALVSRATDANGVIQPSADDPAIKLKKTYYEASQQYPRKIQL